jgi:hypothetical protein
MPIYNHTAAVDYAIKYALSYNPEYPSYVPGTHHGDGDCANFIAQCLYAGGWPMINPAEATGFGTLISGRVADGFRGILE